MRTLPIYLVFLVMGFGDLIGPLVSLVKENLQTTQVEASFIAFAGFIMFGLLSIPVGVLQANVGKKPVAFGGLILVLAGATELARGLANALAAAANARDGLGLTTFANDAEKLASMSNVACAPFRTMQMLCVRLKSIQEAHSHH